jgi:NTP pyrophosphatase (non-canonical NTP hydrolase)
MNLNEYAEQCHKANAKWWPEDVRTRNKGEAIALMHSELSEALEGERKNLMDDKLPHRKMAEVEFVDTLIRIFDYCHAFGYDLEGAFQEKMAYNAIREDHKLENRMKENGKKF